MAARMTGELRHRIRQAARIGPLPMVAALYDVTTDDVRSVVESEPTPAELAAKAKIAAAVFVPNE